MRATSTRRDACGWWLTKDVALSAGEWGTSLAAAAMSTSAYLRHGRTYLGPGVVGDLAGFALLGAALRHSEARLRHEAAWCLACIGAVICARQEKLERLPAPLLWGSFAAGLSPYVAARQRVCD